MKRSYGTGDFISREEWIQMRLRGKMRRDEPPALVVAALVAGIVFVVGMMSL